MAKTKEDLNELKGKIKIISNKPIELAEDVLRQVIGGGMRILEKDMKCPLCGQGVKPHLLPSHLQECIKKKVR